jgi:serine O-acetyltransferase
MEKRVKFREYKYLVLSDLYRHTGAVGARRLLRPLLIGEGLKYQFWMRTCAFTVSRPWLRFLAYPVARLMLMRVTYKLGISIPYRTKIGPGFYIGHFGGIVVNHAAVIGRNCNISQGVTIGQANRGSREGTPTIGDNVYIGPGAKIVGAVRIGNNVAIGANCVVTADVPDNGVVVGVPGRVISTKGSEAYVNDTDYDQHLLKPRGRPAKNGD